MMVTMIMVLVVMVLVMMLVNMVILVVIQSISDRTDGIGYSVIHDCVHAHSHTVLGQDLGGKSSYYNLNQMI